MTDRTDNPSSQSVDRESHDYRCMVWIALVAILSAALAGSYGWGLASVHESSETEKLLADYTFWLMLFTAVLAVATIGLGIATLGLYLTGEKQIGLLHRQFVATHRPKVVVRFIQGPAKTEEGGLCAWITFANTGPTEATVVALGYDLGLRQGDRWIGGIDGEPKSVTPFSLQSGDRHTVEVKAREDEDLNFNIGFIWEMWKQPAVVRSGSQPELCVVGEVRYRDGNGVVRHTGFLRVYDHESGKWFPDTASNGDYED